MKYTSAKDLMTADVKTVEAHWPVERVAEFLVEYDISGAPVVEDDTLVGVVSVTDLARYSSAAGNRSPNDRPAAFYRSALEHRYAEEEIDRLRMMEGDETAARDLPEVYDVSERQRAHLRTAGGAGDASGPHPPCVRDERRADSRRHHGARHAEGHRGGIAARCQFSSGGTRGPYRAGIPSAGVEASMKERRWSFAVPRSSSRRYIICPLR